MPQLSICTWRRALGSAWPQLPNSFAFVCVVSSVFPFETYPRFLIPAHVSAHGNLNRQADPSSTYLAEQATNITILLRRLGMAMSVRTHVAICVANLRTDPSSVTATSTAYEQKAPGDRLGTAFFIFTAPKLNPLVLRIASVSL